MDLPLDKWRIVKVVFFLHGISALLPWNMLINADSYFIDYKLKPSNETAYANDTTLENYRRNFLPYLSTASKAPNIIFQLINLLFSSSYKSYRIRMNLTFLVQILIFILMIILAYIDTSSWPEVFFWITMVVAVLFNTVNGIFQSCIYGIAAKFPMEYINYVTFGFSFSGTISCIFLIVSLLLSPHPRTVAIYYFSFATVFMIICYINEILITKNNFFRKFFHEITHSPKHSTVVVFENRCQDSVKSEDGYHNVTTTVPVTVHTSGAGDHTWLQTYGYIFRKSWMQILNTILVFGSSFTVFPTIHANIAPMDERTAIVERKFFTPIFCFLFFNTFGAIGNIFAERYRKPKPRTLIYFVLVRFAFIPFFLFCNYIPDRRRLPVLVQSDTIYIIGSALFSFTMGWASSLAMMYAPKCVPPEHASMAAMMASAAVIIGIIIGVQCSMILQAIV